jgi:hypothetical protein
LILADTGPLIAAWDPRESRHSEIAAWLRTSDEPVGVPAPVIFEVAYFLGKRLGAQHEARFLAAMGDGGTLVEDPTGTDYARAAELILEYADFPLGTVDALVIALAERLDIATILTLDRRHFGAVRPRHCERLTLVP